MIEMENMYREELINKIQNESDMLIGCRNRMCVTDDKNELVRVYAGLISRASNLYNMNLIRICSKQSKKSEERLINNEKEKCC